MAVVVLETVSEFTRNFEVVLFAGSSSRLSDSFVCREPASATTHCVKV